MCLSFERGKYSNPRSTFSTAFRCIQRAYRTGKNTRNEEANPQRIFLMASSRNGVLWIIFQHQESWW